MLTFKGDGPIGTATFLTHFAKKNTYVVYLGVAIGFDGEFDSIRKLALGFGFDNFDIAFIGACYCRGCAQECQSGEDEQGWNEYEIMQLALSNKVYVSAPPMSITWTHFEVGCKIALIVVYLP